MRAGRKKTEKKALKYHRPLLKNAGNIKIHFKYETSWLDQSLLLAQDKKEDGEGPG